MKKIIVILFTTLFVISGCKNNKTITSKQSNTNLQSSSIDFDKFKLLGNKVVNREDFDIFIHQLIDSLDIPALSIALINGENVVFHQNYGYKNLKDSSAVDANTIFEAASISKAFFSYAVMMLINNGEIELDKPLFEYLPFEDLAYDSRSREITARMILTHRTGIPNWRTDKLKFDANPGTKHTYSGEAFEYLGKVVEKIKQKSLNDVLDSILIKKYDMKHSSFIENEMTKRNMSTGHEGRNPTGRNMSMEAHPAFGLMTNAEDFAKFLSSVYTTPLFKEMCDKQVNIDSSQSVGLGIFSRETAFGPKYYHSGNNGNRFTGRFEVYPDENFGFVFFTNSGKEEYIIEEFWRYLGLYSH
ncbi:MAG TPA: serine hydrolase domain-containing protein [Saprospiraceae bacterium]|nr:serine hydrolase domain-containing protein [Saprospiraceae bacterium]